MRPFRNKFRHRHRVYYGKSNKIRCSDCYARNCTLADVPPGCRARVSSYSDNLKPGRNAHLLAYGLMPGRWVKVLRHSPVVIVQVDHTDLALELEIALEVKVDEIAEF